MEEPTDEDCCHSDCTNCIFDVYKKLKDNQETLSRTNGKHISFVMSSLRYKEFILFNVVPDSSDTNIYTFIAKESIDCEGQLNFNPGQHVVLRNDPRTDEEHFSRAYTLIPWHCTSSGAFSVVVKLYTDGKMSRVIRQSKIGEIFLWRGPYGEFTYRPNTYSKVAMVCMGTGVAPMFAVAKRIVYDEKDETLVHLIQGCRTVNEIVLRLAINSLTQFWNFRCTRSISEGYEENEKMFNEDFVGGRICPKSIAEILKPQDKPILVLICGSKDFNDSTRVAAIEAGVNDEHIYVFS